MEDFRETAWDHVSGSKTATFTTSERKWIKIIKKLKEEHPDDVDIRSVNEDGSIVVHIPVEWLRIRPKKKSNLTEEQIAASTKRLELARRKRLDSLNNIEK